MTKERRLRVIEQMGSAIPKIVRARGRRHDPYDAEGWRYKDACVVLLDYIARNGRRYLEIRDSRDITTWRVARVVFAATTTPDGQVEGIRCFRTEKWLSHVMELWTSLERGKE
jgi:hypothetical protein